jgi:signal transduction histidine kinase/DNA-binding response OmpR family regulator
MTISLDKLNACYEKTPIAPVDRPHGSTEGIKMMTNNSCILVVDDQPDNIRTLSAMLSVEGYKVRKALNGETALEAAQLLSPDLILLDVMMPQMNGYEVCSALKASVATREIPVIFLSALSEIADKAQAFTVGGLDYITKPFQAEEVLLRVSHQLTIHSQRRALAAQNDRLRREIENCQQAEAVIQRQVQQERLLGEIIRHISQSLQLDEILTIAVEEIRHFLQVDQVLIFQFTPDWSATVVAEAVHAEPFSLLGQTFDSLPWTQYWQKLFAQDQHDIDAALYAGKLQLHYAELLANFQIQVSLSFPILHQDTRWGIIVAHHTFTPRGWMAWEVDFLQQCTAQLAIAIQHSELYHHLEEEVQERTADLQQALEFETLLKQITDSVRDSLDEHQILQGTVDGLSRCLAVEFCEVSLYSADQSTSTVTYQSELCDALAVEQALAIATDELNGQLLQKQLFQFCWCQSDSLQQAHVGYTVLACPIFDDQQVLGSLWLLKPGESSFTDLEIRLVKQIANQCAIALRQSQLYQAAQTQVRELQKLHQLKDDFLNTISHELRTPIANMKMVIRLLLIATGNEHRSTEDSCNAAVSSSKIPQYLDILQEECEQELQLIEDLLNLQHLEAGTQPLELKSIDLDLWVSHIIEPFERRFFKQQQTLQLNLSNLPLLTTDSFCLSRILTELLNNACKYTPAGEIITIATYPGEETVSISITNTGVEIPVGQIALIFDKFYRIPNYDPWKYGGTGLGLALVKKLVEHLNGKIEAQSGNNFTCFTVTLPLLLEPLNP